MNPAYKRKRLLVDPAFQFRVMGRMLCYFVLFVVVVVHIAFLFEFMLVFASPRLPEGGVGGIYLNYLDQQKRLLAMLLFVSPVLLYDLLKFSNRFAGPLYRCRKVMQQMARGEAVPEFKPRKKDLMADLFEDFNTLIKAWNARLEAENQARQEEAAVPVKANGALHAEKQPA